MPKITKPKIAKVSKEGAKKARAFAVKNPTNPAVKAYIAQMHRGNMGDKIAARHIVEEQALHMRKRKK